MTFTTLNLFQTTRLRPASVLGARFGQKKAEPSQALPQLSSKSSSHASNNNSLGQTSPASTLAPSLQRDLFPDEKIAQTVEQLLTQKNGFKAFDDYAAALFSQPKNLGTPLLPMLNVPDFPDLSQDMTPAPLKQLFALAHAPTPDAFQPDVFQIEPSSAQLSPKGAEGLQGKLQQAIIRLNNGLRYQFSLQPLANGWRKTLQRIDHPQHAEVLTLDQFNSPALRPTMRYKFSLHQGAQANQNATPASSLTSGLTSGLTPALGGEPNAAFNLQSLFQNSQNTEVMSLNSDNVAQTQAVFDAIERKLQAALTQSPSAPSNQSLV
ncbi:MAG: hypothetical protein VKJ06_07720 [Vampirovibrionales bacterium]|nr:hypothetical protein [Vampirovibrionales bacterium]